MMDALLDENEVAAVIEITDQESSLTIRFPDRSRPVLRDRADDFVMVLVEAVVRGSQTDILLVTPGSQGQFEASLRMQDLRRLREEIARLHRDLKGEIEWEVEGAFLELTAQIGVRGEINWEISLQYPGEPGEIIEFRLWNDQSYLPALLRQIDAVFAAYLLAQS